MTPQELKSSILQLAILGKLVEQRPEEGTAEDLYRQIQADKQDLIKAGKLKKEKPLPEITEEEMPFDIPESWMWVRLRSIVFNRGQETPTETFCYIDIGSIDNKRQLLNANETLIEPKDAPSRARKLVERGDILYSTVRPYLHNMCIVDREFSRKPIASTGFAALACYNGLYNKYLFYYLLAPAFDSYANDTENAKGVAYPAINDDRLYHAIVALPPLAEQKRIVAKIEELLPLIDRYEQAWTKLEAFNKRFPADMQKSLLQLAIQGKLVDQRPQEGTGEDLYRQIQAEKQSLIRSGKLKKDKPLPPISNDELPFDIPESWKWIKLGTVASVLGGKRIPAGRRLTNENTGHIYIRVSDMKNGSVHTSNLLYVPSDIYPSISRYIINKEDVYITVAGTIGAVGTVPPELDGANLTENADRLVFSNIDQAWLVRCLQSSLVQNQIAGATTKVGQPKLAIMRIQELIIPLPPLAEQKRIVAKLESLLPLCDKLKGAII